ncbi:D-2-hydroxyacid dehydrogenase family protein [Phenylobacterium immobile]|uniref:D-2-hydroxyacid dehydrogenase family protein n=1 Tax=Phenylobacterium immobile TaxID=21 RepID=UPI000A73A347|nr:D-2-hydroxyacid dehydrogenase family protein [Phenylobacterium immobile]
MKIAILDDYQQLARRFADWSRLSADHEISVFDRHLSEDEAAQALAPFDIVCHMRERMAFPAQLIAALPNLKLIAITGRGHRTLDLEAAKARGVTVCGTDMRPGTGGATTELAWGMILAAQRHIVEEAQGMRQGGWQTTAGAQVAGRTLGVLGLGRLGRGVARVAQAFDMRVIAWSQNLAAEAARAVGVERVEKDELFRQSDILSIHLVLSDRSRGLVGAEDLGRMKPGALLVNTSRGPIVEATPLLAALRSGAIRAALDVFDEEPLPVDDPLRTAPNVLLTPHLGYVTEETMRGFYEDTVENIAAFLVGQPMRVVG